MVVSSYSAFAKAAEERSSIITNMIVLVMIMVVVLVLTSLLLEVHGGCRELSMHESPRYEFRLHYGSASQNPLVSTIISRLRPL